MDASPESSIRVMGDDTLFLGNTLVRGNLTVYGDVIASEEEAIGVRVFRQDTAPVVDTTFVIKSLTFDDIDLMTGYFAAVSPAYAGARDSTSATYPDNANVALWAGQWHDGSMYRIHRSALTFDTSSIPDGTAIDSAKVVLVTIYNGVNAAFRMALVEPTFTGSYSKLWYNDITGHSPGNVYSVTLLSDSLSADTVNAIGDSARIAINTAGKSAISDTDSTRFMLMSMDDVNNVTQTSSQQRRLGFNEDAVYLQIWYTAAGEIGEVALSTGDIWIDTNDGDKPYSWTGSAWSPAYTSINGGYITTNTVNLNKLTFTPLVAAGADSSAIIATINASAEGITIAADNISIDGTTTFSAGYNPTGKLDAGGAAADINANETTINGGKITANTVSVNALTFHPVNRDSVIAAINVSPDSSYLSISGSKINVTGLTTFSSGYDPSEKTVTLRTGTAPTIETYPLLREGDRWIDIDDGNRPYSWDGDSWEADLTIIDGGSIMTGYVRSTVMRADSITAGTFTGLTFQTAAAGTGKRVVIDSSSNAITVLDASNNEIVSIGDIPGTGYTSGITIPSGGTIQWGVGKLAKATIEATNGNAEFTGTVFSIGGFYGSSGATINEFSTDVNLADSSNTAVPTEAAVKAYVRANIGGSTAPASGTVTSETSFGVSATAGAASTYSRGDHTHGTPANPVTGHESTYSHSQYNTAYSHSQTTTGNPHSLDAADVGADASGTAASAVSSHQSSYNHSNYNTAYSHSQITTGNPHNLDATDVGAAASSHSHAIAYGATGGSAGNIAYWNTGSNVAAWGSPATAGVAASSHSHGSGDITGGVSVSNFNIVIATGTNPGSGNPGYQYRTATFTNGILTSLAAATWADE
jgi:hypothetical protein